VLRKLVKDIATAASGLRSICDDLGDPNARTLSRAFKDRAAGLDHRIAQALRAWGAASSGRYDSQLCYNALRLLKGKDGGVINYIDTNHLDGLEKSRLQRKGGSYQLWHCLLCEFETKYYIRKARNAAIEHTEDTITLLEADIKYRAVLLAKSHLHRSSRQPLTFGCVLCLAQGRELVAKESGFKTEKGLVHHIGTYHNIRDLPRIFMEKLHFSTATAHKHGDRYDVKFLRA
jgi:hypothetical protein